MKTEAVIFDMDGVIVDSEPRHERAFLDVVAELGFGDCHGLIFSDYLGRTDQELWVDFITKNKPPCSLEQLLEMKRRRVIEILRRDQPLFNGLPALLQKLTGRYRLGLASGSERLVINEVLEIGSLRNFFSATVSATEVKHGKPAPDIFLRTAELLGAAPADCWVIEDSKPGIAAGLAAGMPVIAIANTHSASELTKATYVVRTYEEIGKLLVDTRPAAGG